MNAWLGARGTFIIETTPVRPYSTKQVGSRRLSAAFLPLAALLLLTMLQHYSSSLVARDQKP